MSKCIASNFVEDLTGKCPFCGEQLNGVSHDPDTCIINLQQQLQAAQTDNEQAENLLRIAISLMEDNPYSRDDDWNDLIVEAEKFLKAGAE